VRIAHRLRDLQALPYIVVTQEGLDNVYEVRSQLTSAMHYLTPPTRCIGLHLTSTPRYIGSHYYAQSVFSSDSGDILKLIH
jgi:hypothetical protein